MADVKAEIQGDKLIITIPFSATGQASASGKTRVHASSRGNVATSAIVNGKPLIVGVNCYTK